MTVQIDATAGLIFLVSCAVGYAVYRHTLKNSTTTPPSGDLGTAFTAASVVLVALAFLFGVNTEGKGSEKQTPSTPPAASISASSQPPSLLPSHRPK